MWTIARQTIITRLGYNAIATCKMKLSDYEPRQNNTTSTRGGGYVILVWSVNGGKIHDTIKMSNAAFTKDRK